MFEHNFNGCKQILVTGCQRSGTTIATKIIADVMGFLAVDENDYSWRNGWEPSLENLLKKSREGCVYQGPAISHEAHKIPSNMAVVFMNRNFQDIRLSMRRVNWPGEQTELAKYPTEYHKHGTIEKIKYAYWRDWQKSYTPNAFELNYDDLRWHPFWVSKRSHFHIKQTT